MGINYLKCKKHPYCDLLIFTCTDLRRLIWIIPVASMSDQLTVFTGELFTNKTEEPQALLSVWRTASSLYPTWTKETTEQIWKCTEVYSSVSLKHAWKVNLTCGWFFWCDFMVTGHFYPTMGRHTVQTQGLLTLDTPSTNLTLFTPSTLQRLIQNFGLRFTMEDREEMPPLCQCWNSLCQLRPFTTRMISIKS